MEPNGAAASQSPLPFGESLREVGNNVRALLADQADLVAAEAHVAMQSAIACVIMAVAAAVFAVLVVFALIGIVALALVNDGLSWLAALGIVAGVCAVVCALLLLALKGAISRKFFAGTRRQLRGVPD